MEPIPKDPQECEPADSIIELERMMQWVLDEDLRIKMAGEEETE